MYRGIYIGRFQPYHHGHHEVVSMIAEDVDELVIGIGSADASHTISNPFTAGERVMMITKSIVELDVDLVTYPVPIEDIDRNSVWVSHIESMSPDFDVAYSNNPLVYQLFSEAGVEVRRIEMINRDEYEGTGIRERMIEKREWRPYVPDPVVEVIEEIDGVTRLRRVSGSDANDA